MLSRAEKEEVVLALPDGRLHLRIRDFSGNMQEIPKKHIRNGSIMVK